MLSSLQLLQPTTVAEASEALSQFGDNAKIYAGGAELLLLLRQPPPPTPAVSAAAASAAAEWAAAM